MDNDKEERFELLYKEITNKYSNEYENNKNKIITTNKLRRKFSILITVIAFLSMISVFMLLMCTDKYDETLIKLWILLLVIIFIVIFFVSLYGGNKISKIRSNIEIIQNNAIIDFTKSFDESLKFDFLGSIPKETYEKAELHSFEHYFSYNLISRKIENNLNFEMARVNTSVRSGDRYRNIFSGMFAVAETSKSLNQVIHIRKHNSEVSFSNLKVDLDSTEFEDLFDVYSSNDITAMQFLTSDAMQKLIEFYNEFNIPFEITIKDKHIYIAFSYGIVFAPPIHLSYSSSKKIEQSDITFVLERYKFQRYYKILNFALRLTEFLEKTLNDTLY